MPHNNEIGAIVVERHSILTAEIRMMGVRFFVCWKPFFNLLQMMNFAPEPSWIEKHFGNHRKRDTLVQRDDTKQYFTRKTGSPEGLQIQDDPLEQGEVGSPWMHLAATRHSDPDR